MIQVVEIRFAAENFRQLMARLRTWLEDESFPPRTLRYRLSEPESVLRVDFELEGQAQAFAQAFDGVVLAQASLDRGATSQETHPRARRHIPLYRRTGAPP